MCSPVYLIDYTGCIAGEDAVGVQRASSGEIYSGLSNKIEGLTVAIHISCIASRSRLKNFELQDDGSLPWGFNSAGAGAWNCGLFVKVRHLGNLLYL